MRVLGLTSIMLAAGLFFSATTANGQSSASPPAPGTTESTNGATTAPLTATGAPPDAANAAPPTRPPDPTLNPDGTQRMAPSAQVGQPSAGGIAIQHQVTSTGREALAFHNGVLLPLITATCVLVLILLLFVIARFRRGANPTPSRTSHNSLLEVLWTLVPVLILVAVAVPSIRLLAAQYRPAPDNAVTLKAIGNQWYWTYEYPDHGGVSIVANMLRERDEVAPGQRYRTDADGPRLLATDNRVVLPVGVPIRLTTTATDVIHSWAVPAFWIKLDAVPGRLNETTFTIERPGVYFGQCSELCGARHGFMPITVEAVPPAVFAQWIRAHGGTMPGDTAQDSARNTQQRNREGA